MKISKEIENLVKRALVEDIGEGDITTKILFPRAKKVKAIILAKEKGAIAGLPIAKLVFKTIDKKVSFIPRVKEGEKIRKNQIIAKISGNCKSILAGERTALNFLSHLSGIATLTGRFVEQTKNYSVKIMDTRKTTPELRLLEKDAVKVGGGKNHRFGLFDGILIKDNHIQTQLKIQNSKFKIQAIRNLIIKAKRKAKKIKVEVEVENYQEARTAIASGADIIMLDNMEAKMIKKIIKSAKNLPKRPLFEVSGGINLKNINQFASLGIDRISIGALTHSAPALDLGLNIYGVAKE